VRSSVIIYSPPQGVADAYGEADATEDDTDRDTDQDADGRGPERVVGQETEDHATDDAADQEPAEADEVAAAEAGVSRLVGTALWHRSNLTRHTRPPMRGSGAVVIVGGRPGRG